MQKPLTISRIETLGKDSLITEINVGIEGRDTTEEEQLFIHKCCMDIHNMLSTNNYKNHPDTIKEKGEQARLLTNCFDTAIYVRPIPNGYQADSPFPWFKVTTSIGDIVIGWRKRVISIDWTDSEQLLTAEQLFREEMTTKDGKLIHAWGYEKAKEYISKIINTH